MTTEHFRNETTVVSSEGSDLVFERTFDAPRERVWQAFMDPPSHPPLVGAARYDHDRGGDGRAGRRRLALRQQRSRSGRRDFPRHIPRDRAAGTLPMDIPVRGGRRRRDGWPGDFTFEDIDGRTRVTSRSHFGSAEAIEGALATGMVQGAVETWDRFATLLEEEAGSAARHHAGTRARTACTRARSRACSPTWYRHVVLDPCPEQVGPGRRCGHDHGRGKRGARPATRLGRGLPVQDVSVRGGGSATDRAQGEQEV